MSEFKVGDKIRPKFFKNKEDYESQDNHKIGAPYTYMEYKSFYEKHKNNMYTMQLKK